MTEPTAVLASASGRPMALQRVSARGRVEGLLLAMTARQHYRNASPDTLETVYTFPLPQGAVLLGLSVEIAGKRLDGAVLPRAQAEERYEEAVASGDSPIMVRRSAEGLHTVDLGNLKPGEEAVIELRWAQLLRVEQGRVRLSVPTTIAPRYGDAQADGGLPTHEPVRASLAAAYPFELEIEVRGPLAQGAIESASHPIEVLRTGADGAAPARATVRLARTGWLDRDVVLAIEVPADAGRAGTAQATVAPDGAGTVVLASFCPVLPSCRPAPLALKVLVDCSGSMAGDSIASARRAVGEVFAGLDPEDRFSYSRFGTQVVHGWKALHPADPKALRHAQMLLDATDADMGGTEMCDALLSMFELGEARGADVLLVTDGAIWAIEPVLEAARRSGHRVFAVGVGSAPGESLLRRLAEGTGGACELVAPNERMEDAIARTFARMRMPRAIGVSIDWGTAPLWATEPAPALFQGDTVHVFAGFGPGVRIEPPVLCFTADGTPTRLQATLAEGGADGTAEAGVLPRMAAWRRIEAHREGRTRAGAAPEWVRELALRHALVTEETHLFLVHVREEADKASGMPTLQQTEQMVAAGWGATASVATPLPVMYRMPRAGAEKLQAFLAEPAAMDAAASYDAVQRPPVWRSAPIGSGGPWWKSPSRSSPPVPSHPDSGANPSQESEDGLIAGMPAPLVRSSPRRLLGIVQRRLRETDGIRALLADLSGPCLPANIEQALAQLSARTGLPMADARLLLLWNLARKLGDPSMSGEHVMAVLRAHLDGAVDPALEASVQASLDAMLARVTLRSW